MSAASRPSSIAPGHARRASVLIVTLWIVVILASVVLVLARSMRVEAIASANDVAAAQAAAIERGAEQYVIALVAQQILSPETLDLMLESDFAAVPMGEGYFWLVRPDYGEDDLDLPVYGLVDECSKINVNTASREVMEMLPAMPVELPAAIIDWRDADDQMTDGGAESEYYMLSSRPYYCKNGPLESLEELLLVRDVTHAVLYGLRSATTWNRGPSLEPLQNLPLGMDRTVVRGLFDYLTIYSAEPPTSANGETRINVTSAQSREQLTQLFTEAFGASRANELSGRMQQQPNPPYRNIFDFANRIGMSAQELAQVAGRLGTSDQVAKGLINVNTAPHDVLMCLPGLDENDVAAMISHRSMSSVDRTNMAWVAEVIPEKAANIGQLITGRSCQYSADIVAVTGSGRAFKRCRIVVDAQGSMPKIVYRRDLTEMGWPLDRQILAALRSGEAIDGGTNLRTTPTFGRSAF